MAGERCLLTQLSITCMHNVALFPEMREKDGHEKRNDKRFPKLRLKQQESASSEDKIWHK